MKQILIFFCTIFILYTNVSEIYGQEIISLLDGKITFEKLEHSDVIYTKTWKGSWVGKIRTLTGVTGEEAFLTNELGAFSPELARILEEKNRIISRQELLNLLKTNQPFALEPNRENAFIEQSSSVITNNNEIIGETYFGISPIQYHWPCLFSYDISLIIDNSIVHIGLNMVDTYGTIPREIPEYFITKEDEIYWKNNDARNSFYERMISDIESMPEQIQTLYEAYNLILETLIIN
jgi:hypothetical protein